MDDRFEFKRLIGKGATGGVYEAVLKETGKTYAVRRFYASDGKSREGWKEEFLLIMKQLARIKHPNVVPVVEAGLDPDGAFMVSDYFPTSKLDQTYPRGMDLKTFKLFVAHGLGALNALHAAGIVHGRLAYDSFLISHQPNGSTQFILKDYGLRRIAPLIQGVHRSKKLPTNPVFLATELFSTGIVTEQTDLYMFGQLCYILLTGCHPIAGKDIDTAAIMHFEHNYKSAHQTNPKIPQAFSNWVDYLTQPDPKQRPVSALEALREFQQAEVDEVCSK